jgi:hypothetical protein
MEGWKNRRIRQFDNSTMEGWKNRRIRQLDNSTMEELKNGKRKGWKNSIIGKKEFIKLPRSSRFAPYSLQKYKLLPEN